jgi:RNA polymerase sigma factor for flagellar operon FliA
MQTEVETDITKIWREYRANPTIELRNFLMEKYMPLVRYNAERIWNRLPDGVELDDLSSSGVFGLLDAIEAFDLERGVKF